MPLRIGNTTSNSVLSPTNKALTNIAKARVASEVSRAVARHENALKVDGSDIYLWVRNNGGLVCTCRQPAKSTYANLNPIDDSPEGLREPAIDAGDLPPPSANSGFKVILNRGVYTAGNADPVIPSNFSGSDINVPEIDGTDGLDGIVEQNLNGLSVLNTVTSDTELATMLNEGAAIYGGDKTPCGICFGTGKTHGYELATGRRLVLDASNEFIYTLYGAIIKPETYPTVFTVGDQDYVEWNVDLPSYTNGWLNFTIRNNLKSAENLKIEWLYKNVWQPLTLSQLIETEGSDRSNTKIRVKMADTSQFYRAEFTHIELIYSTAKPIVGQCPPLSFSVNFEILEPIINTEFEILASVNEIPRESVFQDSKFKSLWKVQEVTPKMTASGQIFSYNVNVRMVHRSEMLYALRVIFDPQINVHYRGLEIIEGGLERDEINRLGADSLTFSLDTGYE